MKVNYLKNQLPSNWRSYFKHHKFYPEIFYDVAEFNIDGEIKILVLNTNTDDIMEYFYDDVENDYWIDLIKLFKIRDNCIDLQLKNSEGIYFINKSYQILNYTYNSIRNLSNKIDLRGSYPRSVFVYKKQSVKISNHVIVASIFVPNPDPENRVIVNHKDLNKSNFSKENLSWETISTNSKKSNRKPLTSKYEWREITRDGKIINTWKNKSEVKLSNINNKVEKVDVLLDNYKKNYPTVETGWYRNKFIKNSIVEANVSGILRINGKETVGNLSKENLTYYLSIKDGDKVLRYLTHRLVYETIKGKKIEDGNVIDHIIPIRDVNSINNSINNLREVSPKENSNNINTLEYIGKRCIKYDLLGNPIKTYMSISEAIRKEGKRSVKDSINNKVLATEHKYLWAKEGDFKSIQNKLKYVYYKYTEDGIVSSGVYLSDTVVFSKELTSSRERSKIAEKIRKSYLNTGIKFTDGYYYQQGFPENLLYNNTNETEVSSKREEINWKKDKRK